MAVRKGSHNTSVINTEELRDSVNRLAPHHVNEERASASTQSLSRLQAKVSSFNAFTGVQKSNRAEKRREVCSSNKLRLFVSALVALVGSIYNINK